MTNARTVEQIIADGARPAAAEQQSQLEKWISEHRVTWSGGSLRPLIEGDEIDAYAADGFMSAKAEILGSLDDTVTRLTEERFGPLPQREPGAAGERLRFIALLHAMIQFLIDNPDLPCPWTASMSIKVSDTLTLAALADRFDARPFNNRYGIPQQVSVFDLFGKEFYAPVSFTVASAEGQPL